MRLLFSFAFILLNFCFSSFAYEVLLVTDQYIYEVYEPADEIPYDVLKEGRSMYYEAYLNPKLHTDIPLEDLHLDPKFPSYEAFIQDLFERDFNSYHAPSPRYYFQVRCSNALQYILILQNNPSMSIISIDPLLLANR